MSCGKIDLRCTKCRLWKKRTQVVPGHGPCSAGLVFVGEAPGRDEDIKGKPFVGRGGKVLDEALEDARISRESVYVTNIVKCRPPDNRKPRKDEVRTCTGLYLESELSAIRPTVICALGQTAAEYFLGTRVKMADTVGHEISLTIGGGATRLYVAFHPAASLHQRKNLEAFRRQISCVAKAAGLTPSTR